MPGYVIVSTNTCRTFSPMLFSGILNQKLYILPGSRFFTDRITFVFQQA